MFRSLSFLTALAGVISFSTPLGAQEIAGPTGSYGAVMEYDASILPAQTIYRPRDMADGGFPIVSWGNGGCANNGGSESRQFLMQLASDGYVIVAPGKPGPDVVVQPTADRVEGLEDATPRVAPPPAPPSGSSVGPDSALSSADQLIAGIDWAMRENERPGSIYFGKLAVTAVAIMGRSCGGLQALAVQSDPRVQTSMIWNSGILDSPRTVNGTLVTKDSLDKIHVPIAYIDGGPTDMAHANAVDDVGRIEDVPVFFGSIPVGHPGTMQQLNGGSNARVAKAWLDWHLRGDESAARVFVGEDCLLCQDPNWTIKRKNMD